MSSASDSGVGEVDVLALTRKKRMALVERLLPDDVDPNSADPKLLKIALNALDGLDRQELTIRRLDVDADTAASNNSIASTLTALFSDHLNGTNPFVAGGGGRVPDERNVALPTLETEGLHLNPGETEIGTGTDNVLTFASRTGMGTETIAGAEDGNKVSEYADKDEE